MSAANIEEFTNYIDGEWVESAARKTFDNINPADARDVVGRFQASTPADARAAAKAAAAAFAGRKRTPISRRNPRYMHRFAQDIQADTVKINRTIAGNLVNAPFGGLKRSKPSTFRESGRTGLEFYTQIKTVYQGC